MFQGEDRTINFTKFYFVLLLIVPFPAFAENQMGSLSLTFEYTNGDRLDPYGISLIIYQNNKENLFEEVNQIETNPFVVSLPIGHRYYLEPVVNGIHLDTTFIDLDVSDKKAKINIPLSGGIKFQVLHSDNYTPIEGALVSIKSQDGKEWGQSVTDEDGETIRFWIQSTINSQDYYIVETSLGSKITHSYLPGHIQPGISQDIKITTDFPKIIQRIDLSIFKEPQNKLVKNDGKFSVELFDTENNLVSKASVNRFGDAMFSLIKIGEYELKIINVTEYPEKLWHTEKIVVKNEVESIKIFPSLDIFSNSNSDVLLNKEISQKLNDCQCVAFRMDDIQDYWLSNAQMRVIDIFQERKIPLTIGLVGGLIGEDEKIISFIKDKLTNGTSSIELANHSINDDRVSQMSKLVQTSVITQTNTIIENIFKVRPTTFIPPGNLFNQETIQVLRENNFTHISASILSDPGPFPLTDSDFYHFPQTAATGKFESDIHTHFDGIQNEVTFSDVMQSIEKHGYAVVMMHPQEFSLWDGEKLINEINLEQINHLETLLDKLLQTSTEFTTIGKINLDSVNEDDFIDSNFTQPVSVDISTPTRYEISWALLGE